MAMTSLRELVTIIGDLRGAAMLVEQRLRGTIMDLSGDNHPVEPEVQRIDGAKNTPSDTLLGLLTDHVRVLSESLHDIDLDITILREALFRDSTMTQAVQGPGVASTHR